MEVALPESYEVCRRIHRRRDPTYYWAARRLPAEVRPATHALYGFVRTADDIVDDPDRASTPAIRRAALDAWEVELEKGLAGTPPEQPVLAALIDAGARHDLPLGELRAYMCSMRVDCAPVRISSREELEGYMDGSAGSVGRIMAPLLGVPRRHHGDFGRLGRAFQHANFIRDVREDWALGRIYLPAEERARFGVEDEDLGRATASPALRALVADEVTRVREAFAAADRWAAPRPIRQAMRLATLTYERMLDRVEAIDCDVLGRRTGVRARQLPGVAFAALRA
ncbi:MAG: phytoene/squalene synthase family protein [Solirubrobacteraceae bacterium]